MNTLLQPRPLTLAGAAAGGLLNVVCLLLHALSRRPNGWMTLFIGSGPTLWGWIVFVAEGAAVGAFIGWVVAVCYNRLAGPARIA